MKHFLLIYSLVILPFFISAQIAKKQIIYTEVGIGIGSYTEIKVSLNYIHKKKFSFQVGFSELKRKSASTPSDYGNYSYFLNFFGPPPYERQYSYEFLIGKLISFEAQNTFRINFKIGLAFSKIHTPVNFQKSTSWLWGSSYTFDLKEERKISLIIEPTIELPFSRVFGISFTPFFKVNSEIFVWGIRLNVILGLLKESAE